MTPRFPDAYSEDMARAQRELAQEEWLDAHSYADAQDAEADRADMLNDMARDKEDQ